MTKLPPTQALKDEQGLSDVQSEIWTTSCQIRALGEMLLHQDTRQPALDEADVWHGYGTLLRQIGERLEALSKEIDEQSVRAGKSESK